MHAKTLYYIFAVLPLVHFQVPRAKAAWDPILPERTAEVVSTYRLDEILRTASKIRCAAVMMADTFANNDASRPDIRIRNLAKGIFPKDLLGLGGRTISQSYPSAEETEELVKGLINASDRLKETAEEVNRVTWSIESLVRALPSYLLNEKSHELVNATSAAGKDFFIVQLAHFWGAMELLSRHISPSHKPDVVPKLLWLLDELKLSFDSQWALKPEIELLVVAIDEAIGRLREPNGANMESPEELATEKVALIVVQVPHYTVASPWFTSSRRNGSTLIAILSKYLDTITMNKRGKKSLVPLGYGGSVDAKFLAPKVYSPSDLQTIVFKVYTDRDEEKIRELVHEILTIDQVTKLEIAVAHAIDLYPANLRWQTGFNFEWWDATRGEHYTPSNDNYRGQTVFWHRHKFF